MTVKRACACYLY